MERVDNFLRKLLVSSSWIRHILFWFVFFGVNVVSVYKYMHNMGAVLSLMSYSIIHILVFYSGYGLYLIARRYNSILLFVVGIMLGPPLFLSWIARAWYLYLNPEIADLLDYFNFYGLYMFLASMAGALKFGKDLYTWQQNEFLRKQEQAESELNFLKAQISPHFLFNTLNNLYGHAVAKSDLLPDMMLRLSDLLRYTIYETSKPLVPLHDELDYINNYVVLEKMRLSKNSNVNFDLPEHVNIRLQIAPLLLISFVENAFKHSRHTMSNEIFINGKIELNDNQLQLEIANSYNPDMKEKKSDKRENGIGLENVYKRLELLYHQKHEIQIEEKENIYTLKLQLDL